MLSEIKDEVLVKKQLVVTLNLMLSFLRHSFLQIDESFQASDFDDPIC